MPPPPNVVGPQGVTTEAITSTGIANIAIIGREFVLVQQLPPYYVFSRKKMRDELLNGGLPGTDGTLTETGWGEKEIYSSNSIC